MKRIPLKRKSDNDKQDLEKLLLKSLPISESGEMIYEGPGSIESRTGSPVRKLIDWVLYKAGSEKPIDSDLFSMYLTKKLNINVNSNESHPSWKQFKSK